MIEILKVLQLIYFFILPILKMSLFNIFIDRKE